MTEEEPGIDGLKLCLIDGTLCTILRVTRHDIGAPDWPGDFVWLVECQQDDDPDVIRTFDLGEITASDGGILLDPTPDEIREHQRTAPLRLREHRQRLSKKAREDDDIPF